MAKAGLEFEFDIPGLTSQLDSISQRINKAVGDIDPGNKVEQELLGISRSLLEILGDRTDAQSKLNIQKRETIKLSEKQKTIDEQIITAHRQALKADLAQRIMDAGGPGSEGIGPYGGRRKTSEQRRGSFAQEGVRNAVGMYYNPTAAGTISGAVGIGRAGLKAAGKDGGWTDAALDIVGGALISSLETDKQRREAMIMAAQTTGRRGAIADQDDAFRSRYGQMFSDAGPRAGMMGKALGRAPTHGEFTDVTAGDVGMGIQSQMVGLMGAGTRGGIRGGQVDIMGQAMGLAVAQELDRGRFGEAFELIAGVAQQTAYSTADIKGIAERFAFIGRMGPAFQGKTAAAQGMSAQLQGFAAGGTPFSDVVGLRAAGLGKGASYASAALKVSYGLDREGGITSKALVASLASSLNITREKYQDADPDGKAMYALLVARASQGKLTQAAADRILHTVFAGVGLAAQFAISPEGRRKFQTLTGEVLDDDFLLQERRARVRKQSRQKRTGEVAQDATDKFWEATEETSVGAMATAVALPFSILGMSIKHDIKPGAGGAKKRFGEMTTDEAESELSSKRGAGQSTTARQMFQHGSAEAKAVASKYLTRSGASVAVVPGRASPLGIGGGGDSGSVGTGGGEALAPLSGMGDVSSPFGKRRRKGVGGETLPGGKTRPHLGTDILHGEDTPVKAPVTGRVVSVGTESESFGDWVSIREDKPKGKARIYTSRHLKDRRVAEGDNTVRGVTVIAGGVERGKSSAPHVHLEATRLGARRSTREARVDPMALGFDTGVLSAGVGGGGAPAGGGAAQPTGVRAESTAAVADTEPEVPETRRVAGVSGSGSSTHVKLTVVDRTSSGVDVVKEQEKLEGAALESAPGEVVGTQ